MYFEDISEQKKETKACGDHLKEEVGGRLDLVSIEDGEGDDVSDAAEDREQTHDDGTDDERVESASGRDARLARVTTRQFIIRRRRIFAAFVCRRRSRRGRRVHGAADSKHDRK